MSKSFIAIAAAALLGIGASTPMTDAMAPRGPRGPHDIYIPKRKNARHGITHSAPNPGKRTKVKAARKANRKRRQP